ncbi:MAG: universal stress protein [Bacillota bacterium]
MLNDKVLLATDFSKTAEQLLHCLDELRLLGFDEVLLTHVINIQNAKIVNVTQFKEANREKLEEVKEKIEDKGFKVEINIPVGSPAVEIEKLAEAKEAGLILIASHGKGLIKRIFLGSTTYNLIRRTSTPVLIEKYENLAEGKLACARKFNRVLLPLDFSECSREAVELVKALGQPLEEIILLAVVESSASREELEKLKSDAGDKLTEIEEELGEIGTANRISHRVEVGAASENIIAAAQTDNVGVIILSKRGQGRIREILLGSTADRVAKESPVPVLLIPCQK